MAKKFPNGFHSWMETHYEVVSHIEDTKQHSGTLANVTAERQGTGGLYELAEELTDKFEAMNKGREWDGEFFDEITEFLNNQKP